MAATEVARMAVAMAAAMVAALVTEAMTAAAAAEMAAAETLEASGVGWQLEVGGGGGHLIMSCPSAATLSSSVT